MYIEGLCLSKRFYLNLDLNLNEALNTQFLLLSVLFPLTLLSHFIDHKNGPDAQINLRINLPSLQDWRANAKVERNM